MRSVSDYYGVGKGLEVVRDEGVELGLANICGDESASF